MELQGTQRTITTRHDIISLRYRLRDDAYAVNVGSNVEELINDKIRKRNKQN